MGRTMWSDFGQFETKTEMVTKRFTANHKINYGMTESNFLTPDKMEYIYKEKDKMRKPGIMQKLLNGSGSG